MTTELDIRERPRSESLISTRRAMGGGLLWAAVLLGILTLWLYQRELEGAGLVALAVLLLAVAALAGAVWQFLRTWPANAPEADVEAALLRQRRTLATGLFAGAAILLALGAWLAFQHGLAVFPEVSGMVVLALIALTAGMSQARPPERAGVDREGVMRWLLERRSAVAGTLLALAFVCAGLALWAFLANDIGPEVVGAALLTLLFFGVGIWQLALPPEDATPHTMRLLILITGGVLGFVVAAVTVWRTWLWWKHGDIFSSEVPLAESPGLWRLWLCAYLEIAGLAVLFGSLLLGRADIRQNVAMRRLLFGYNAVLTGLLLLATLALLNVVVFVVYPYTLQWTQSLGLYSLSPSSKNLLQSLRQPVHAYILMAQGSDTYRDTRTLLENAQGYTRLLRLEAISPDKDSVRYERLTEKYPALRREDRMIGLGRQTGRGVLLVYGTEEGAQPARSAFISVNDLEKEDFDQRRKKPVRTFQGEDAIMTQLRLLAEHEVKPKLYFTQSNEELLIEDALRDAVSIEDIRGGAGQLVTRLKKDNYDVRGLIWTARPKRPREKGPADDLMVYARADEKAKPQVPADAKVLILAAPLRPYPRDVQDALEAYMERGGKLILLSNYFTGPRFPLANPDLEGFLRKYNVELGKDVLMRMPENLQTQSPLIVVAAPPADSRNKVAANFLSSRFPLGGALVGVNSSGIGLARSVRPGTAPGGYRAEVLLQVSEAGNGPVWAESDLTAFRDLIQYLRDVDERIDTKKSKEPIPVAVGVVDKDGKPRLAVFGDARFASNRFVRDAARYYDFLTSTIEWLAERPGNIGIRPRESIAYDIQPDQVNFPRLIWLPLGLVLLVFLALGMGLWVVRRR
jgi:hypothetical protein